MKEQKIKDLIQYLLDHPSFVTISEVASALNCSSRTIHNYLSNPVFIKIIGDYNLEKKQNKGIRLIVNETERFHIQRQLDSVYPFHENEIKEIYSLILYLLMSDKQISLDSLAKKQYMSITSLRNIITSANTYLKEYDVEISTRNNSHIEIVGNESNIRDIYFDILSNHLNGIYNTDEFIHARLNKITTLALTYNFELEFSRILLSIINRLEIMIQSYFVDDDYNNLLIYLIIMIQRNKTKHYSLPINHKKLSDTQEYLWSSLLVNLINESFNITLSEQESIYLTEILLSLRKQVNPLPAPLSNDIIEKFVTSIGDKLNINLTNSTILKQNLLLHLRPALHRLKYGISSNNQLLEKIKDEYTDVYISVMTTIDELEEENDIFFDANEIGFICLHVVAEMARLPKLTKTIKTALICYDGLSFELYLHNTIEKHFPAIKIEKIIRKEDNINNTLDSFDLVLSSSTTTQSIPNILQISTFLNEKDIELIDQTIHTNNHKNKGEENLLDHLLFFTDTLKDRDKILEKYCKLLVDEDYVDEHYFQSVIERLSVNNAYVSRGIAVPHGFPEHVKKSLLIIINLEEPIVWDDDMVSIVIFVVANKKTSKEFNNLLRKIIHIAASPTKTKELLACSDSKGAYNIISSIDL